MNFHILMHTQSFSLLFQVENKQVMLDLTSPMVTDDPDRVKSLINIHSDPYDAASGAHAIVICTEWDEFNVN